MLKVQRWWTTSPGACREERDSNANLVDPTFAMPLKQIELNGLGVDVPIKDGMQTNRPLLRAHSLRERSSVGAFVERPRDAQWRLTADTTPTGHAMACAAPS